MQLAVLIFMGVSGISPQRLALLYSDWVGRGTTREALALLRAEMRDMIVNE
jgi:hypothetical protein